MLSVRATRVGGGHYRRPSPVCLQHTSTTRAICRIHIFISQSLQNPGSFSACSAPVHPNSPSGSWERSQHTQRKGWKATTSQQWRLLTGFRIFLPKIKTLEGIQWSLKELTAGGCYQHSQLKRENPNSVWPDCFFGGDTAGLGLNGTTWTNSKAATAFFLKYQCMLTWKNNHIILYGLLKECQKGNAGCRPKAAQQTLLFKMTTFPCTSNGFLPPQVEPSRWPRPRVNPYRQEIHFLIELTQQNSLFTIKNQNIKYLIYNILNIYQIFNI